MDNVTEPMFFALLYVLSWDECLWRKLSKLEEQSLPRTIQPETMTRDHYLKMGEDRIGRYEAIPALQKMQDDLLTAPWEVVSDLLSRGILSLVKVS